MRLRLKDILIITAIAVSTFFLIRDTEEKFRITTDAFEGEAIRMGNILNKCWFIEWGPKHDDKKEEHHGDDKAFIICK